MRDVRDTTLTSAINSQNDGSVVVITNVRNIWTAKTQRSDSVSTLQKHGVWITPTNYEACYFFTGTETFMFRGKRLTSPFINQTCWGKYAWSDWASGLNQSPNIYGVDLSFSPRTPAHLLFRMEESLRQQLNDQNWDIGQFLGELPETVQFLISTVKKVTALVKAVKRRDVRAIFKLIGKPPTGSPNAVRRAVRHAKSTSSAFLAVQYGWLPLLSDARNAIDLAINGLNAKKRNPTVRSSAKEELPMPARTTSGTTISASWAGFHEVSGEVAYELGNAGLTGLDSLGLLDPLSVAWELTPMSFVVDWFIPVGSFIDALTGPIGLTFLYGYRTRYVEWSADMKFTLNATYLSGTPGNVHGSLHCFRREIYLGFPIPVPFVRGIGSELKLGFSRSISLLALAIQRA